MTLKFLKEQIWLNNSGTKERGLVFIDAYIKPKYPMTYITVFSKGSQETDVNVNSPKKRTLGSGNAAPSCTFIIHVSKVKILGNSRVNKTI